MTGRDRAPQVVEDVDDDHDFNWQKNAGDVIVRSQPAVAVYTNPKGDVVLRQECDGLSRDGEDDVVWFAVDRALVVAAAILEAAGLDATATALTADPHRR